MRYFEIIYDIFQVRLNFLKVFFDWYFILLHHYYVFNINVLKKFTKPDWFVIIIFFWLENSSNITNYSVFNCFIFFLSSKRSFSYLVMLFSIVLSSIVLFTTLGKYIRCLVLGKATGIVTAWKVWIFFWSVFSCSWAEYGDLICKSPYSVRIQENTDQKKHRIRTLFTQWVLTVQALHVFLKALV